ncbi:MAG: tRNA(Met) cytidine acetyltransferase [Gammaproteobacteria bacterium]|nr:tRNA(Met) cytidine acetyltransferase [Gammaproteobacteria bacterium]
MSSPVSSPVSAGRRLLLLCGTREWADDWLVDCLPTVVGERRDEVLWVAHSAPPPWTCIDAASVIQRLGSECGLLVFNAHDGLHPDALAAAAGTLRGGGDLVLILPDLADWTTFADPDKQRFAAWPHSVDAMPGHFLARLQRLLNGCTGVHRVSAASAASVRPRLASAASAGIRLNADQEQAVAAIERVAHGHARRPLVMTADRGRGKSTALGVAAARLLLGGLRRILVLAPHSAAVATLWRHAADTAGVPGGERSVLPIADGELRLGLPGEFDEAVAAGADLVIVDEAAAIPVAVLDRLLANANRLVFASTVHGYEGSGRGFELRFRAALSRSMPQWRALQLDVPVRWPADDPLEHLLNRALLMDAELPDADEGGWPDSGGRVAIEVCDAVALLRDEGLLRQVVGLLVNAHYQTRPSDLRQLLDNPDLYLWLARANGYVVGVLLALGEGGFDDRLAGQIMAADRRPRGHLLPQSLAVHAGIADCLQQRVLRVQRIAVHPARRRRGIARELMAAAEQWAKRNGFDLLGCAFGVEHSLLAFWQSLGFAPVRLGAKVDPASAAHSLFMLRGLSPAGNDLAGLAARTFSADLPWLLGASLASLDSRLAIALLRRRDCTDLAFGALQRRELERIRDGARQPLMAEALLWRAAVHLAAHEDTPGDAAPLCAWMLQHRTQQEVCAQFGFAGRRALQQYVQDQVASLCDSG